MESEKSASKPRGHISEISCKPELELAQLLLAFETGGQIHAVQEAITQYAITAGMNPHVVVIDLQPCVPSRATHLNNPISKHFTPYTPGKVVMPLDVEGADLCKRTVLSQLAYLKSGGMNENGDYARVSYANVHHQELVTDPDFGEDEQRLITGAFDELVTVEKEHKEWQSTAPNTHVMREGETKEDFERRCMEDRAEFDRVGEDLKERAALALARYKECLRPSQERLRENRNKIDQLELRSLFDVPIVPLKKHDVYNDPRFLYHVGFLGAILDEDQIAVTLVYHGDINLKQYLGRSPQATKLRESFSFFENVVDERTATFRKLIDESGKEEGIYLPCQQIHFWMPLSELNVFFYNTTQLRVHAFSMQKRNLMEKQEQAQQEKESKAEAQAAETGNLETLATEEPKAGAQNPSS